MTWNASGLNDEGTFVFDELLVKNGQSELRTIAQGANEAGSPLERGTVLGKITTSGKLTVSVETASDGSQVPYAVLAESADASAADDQAVVFIRATLNQNSLIFGAGHSVATVYDPLRAVGINLVKAVI